MEIYDVIIIGTGPAGLTAGLYASRARLRTLLLEKEVMGGELMNRNLIENYPGFPDGVPGPDLGSQMLNQVMNYGTEIKLGEVSKIEAAKEYNTVKTSSGDYQGKAIIIAGGAHPRKLGVPGEREFADKGVFYCATCDGPRFANKTVVVAGGGDSGLTEGLFLAGFVAKVIIVEMSPRLNATKVLQERALANPKISIRCRSTIENITGDEQVKAVEITDLSTAKRLNVKTDGVLVHIGIEPNTAYLKDVVPLSSSGQVLADDKMASRVPGIFAAGDIRQGSPMQISTAVGDGATAAISAQRFLTQGR